MQGTTSDSESVGTMGELTEKLHTWSRGMANDPRPLIDALKNAPLGDAVLAAAVKTATAVFRNHLTDAAAREELGEFLRELPGGSLVTAEVEASLSHHVEQGASPAEKDERREFAAAIHKFLRWGPAELPEDRRIDNAEIEGLSIAALAFADQSLHAAGSPSRRLRRLFAMKGWEKAALVSPYAAYLLREARKRIGRRSFWRSAEAMMAGCAVLVAAVGIIIGVVLGSWAHAVPDPPPRSESSGGPARAATPTTRPSVVARAMLASSPTLLVVIPSEANDALCAEVTGVLIGELSGPNGRIIHYRDTPAATILPPGELGGGARDLMILHAAGMTGGADYAVVARVLGAEDGHARVWMELYSLGRATPPAAPPATSAGPSRPLAPAEAIASETRLMDVATPGRPEEAGTPRPAEQRRERLRRMLRSAVSDETAVLAAELAIGGDAPERADYRLAAAAYALQGLEPKTIAGRQVRPRERLLEILDQAMRAYGRQTDADLVTLLLAVTPGERRKQVAEDLGRSSDLAADALLANQAAGVNEDVVRKVAKGVRDAK